MFNLEECVVKYSQIGQDKNGSEVKAIMATLTSQQTVVRTSRGLSIAGTRITLYNIMDYLQAGWPPKLIQDRLNLTNQQITDVLNYIKTHQAEVEQEYQLVLDQAEEIRAYWETRNRERLTEIAAMPVQPGQEEIQAKLEAWKKKLELA